MRGGRATVPPVQDFERQRLRSRLEASLLDSGADAAHVRYGAQKAAVIGAMSGTVVELGPGTGANMRYYSPGTRVIGIEPNPAMHERLRASADQHHVDLEIRTLRGESIDVDDNSASGVVGTLVLCGVDDPGQVVGEIRRVLRPGGTYFFLEHVLAPERTMTRRAQRVLRRPNRWLFNGCEPTRDTAMVLRSAGFSELGIDEVDEGARAVHVRHRIVGTAIE